MPHSDLHQSKKKKNLAVLAAIFALVALIWVVAMIKTSQNW